MRDNENPEEAARREAEDLAVNLLLLSYGITPPSPEKKAALLESLTARANPAFSLDDLEDRYGWDV